METQDLGGSAGRGSFSCFHGEEVGRIGLVTMRRTSAIAKKIEDFYAEARRLLPLDDMPDLADCIDKGGHCFGLADPVTNIILNAVSLLPDTSSPQLLRSPLQIGADREEDEDPHTDEHSSYLIAYASFKGLLAFMTYYFRNMSHTQATRFLSLASFDLRLAIRLVHHDRFMSSESVLPKLLPDEGKLKAALRVAAVKAKHPMPDVLAQLMTAKYPGHVISTTYNWLRESKQPLTSSQVYEIKNFLATSSNQPLPNIQFWRRPNGNVSNCKRLDDGTVMISGDIGDDLVAQVSIKHRSPDGSMYICNSLLYNADVETKLSECLALVASCRGGKPCAMDDDSPCEHLLSLKRCLLDTIHGFYIKALARLPGFALSAELIRSMLVAGHCYGPFDPVSNIILNSIWYDTFFPVESDIVELPQDILDTIHMARMESHSLDGLVASRGHNSTKHEAFEEIFSLCCKFSAYSEPTFICMAEFTCVAEAAKHPQYAACGSFLNSLSSSKVMHLLYLLSAPPGEKLEDLKWRELRRFITEEVRHVESVPVPKEAPCSLSSSATKALSRRKDMLRSNLSFVRSQVESVLRDYCHQHPWESNFKLDIVCGVTLSSSRHVSNVYHVNFLATPEDEANTERILFFAEFWAPVSSEAPPPPRCCPLKKYFQFTGRCTFCETGGSKVVHPASGGYYGDTGDFESLYRPNAHKSDFGRVLDADYTYFDPDRDVELAKTINSLHSHEYGSDVYLMMPS